MKKQSLKKLALSRETLTLMNARNLATVQGQGTNGVVSGGSDCVTTTWQENCNCGVHLAG